MEVLPYSYFWWCGYFWGPSLSFVMADEFSVRVITFASRIGAHKLTTCFSIFWSISSQWIMVILSKRFKSENLESHNSLKLIRGLCWNFIYSESFLESNWQTWDDSIDSGNFSVRGYLPLILKDCTTHVHGLAVYAKKGFPFTPYLSLNNFTESYLGFQLASVHSVSYFFFLYQSLSSSLCTVFGSISSNIGKVLSINPSTNVFVFGETSIMWTW